MEDCHTVEVLTEQEPCSTNRPLPPTLSSACLSQLGIHNQQNLVQLHAMAEHFRLLARH